MPRLPIRAPASLALLAALVLAAPAPAGAAQDSKKNADAEAKFLAAFRAAGEDDTARSKAVLDLNDAPDAVKVNALLKKVLPREDAPKVISAAIGVLRGVKDPAALKVLARQASGGDKRRRRKLGEAWKSFGKAECFWQAPAPAALRVAPPPSGGGEATLEAPGAARLRRIEE